MIKSMLSLLVLIAYCVNIYSCDVIPVPIHRHHNLDVHSVNIDSRQHNPHVFEIEPSSAPLRLVFSSESSPLYLDVEKAFRLASDVKTDRKGTVASEPDAEIIDTGVGGDSNGGGAHASVDRDDSGVINDDEYTIVDSYSRYVPVKVRNSMDEVMSTEPRLTVESIKSEKFQTNMRRKEIKKVKLSAKIRKATTATVPAQTTSAVVTEPTPSTEASNKFGARISRHTETEDKVKKSADNKQKSSTDDKSRDKKPK